jgi:hypothetical protein
MGHKSRHWVARAPVMLEERHVSARGCWGKVDQTCKRKMVVLSRSSIRAFVRTRCLVQSMFQQDQPNPKKIGICFQGKREFRVDNS